MKIQVLKNESYSDISNLPTRGTLRSTGYDIVATSDPEIVGEKNEFGYSRIDYIQYKTNLKMAVYHPSRHVGDYDVLVMPRSSISKYNLVLANSVGLIDPDYRGEILVRFKYIWQPEDYFIQTKLSDDGSPLYQFVAGKPNLDKIYKKGDKICQLKVTRVEPAEFYLVDELDKTTRGDGGFGSTDTTIKPEYKGIGGLYEKNASPSNKPRYEELMKQKEKV